MKINFSKYNGAGNDFILIDDRENLINKNKSLISYLCDRNFGVGADGLIILKSLIALILKFFIILLMEI